MAGTPAERARKRRERLREEGRCQACTRPLDRPGRSLCAACCKKGSASGNRWSKAHGWPHQKARRARLKREGLCDACGHENDRRPYYVCTRCSKARDRARLLREAKRRERGVCVTCEGEMDRVGRECSLCLARHRGYPSYRKRLKQPGSKTTRPPAGASGRGSRGGGHC